MEELTKSNAAKPRKRDPEAKKQVLIQATLDTVAEIGITDTSVSRIIERAGLSRGMIQLHFGGKDNLLTAAAQQFSVQYYANLDRLTGLNPDASAEETIMAVVRADLSETLLNPRNTKIWHAFRGVASSHPGIARYSSTQDEKLVTTLYRAFEELAQADMPHDQDVSKLAADATDGTLALLEGMWVNYLTDMDGFSRENAVALVQRFLSGLFPGKFRS
ncbi:MAG: TetR family transcriptional regulator C-terminal domain-containing protein [Pseudomonadota bacterium]